MQKSWKYQEESELLICGKATSATFTVDLRRCSSDEDVLKKWRSAPLSVTVPRSICAPVVFWGGIFMSFLDRWQGMREKRADWYNMHSSWGHPVLLKFQCFVFFSNVFPPFCMCLCLTVRPAMRWTPLQTTSSPSTLTPQGIKRSL